jgi:hypothetical protein
VTANARTNQTAILERITHEHRGHGKEAKRGEGSHSAPSNELSAIQCPGAASTAWTRATIRLHHSRVRVLTHIKKLDDCFGQFMVRVSCVCGASRHIEPEGLARLIGWSRTLDALAPRLRCFAVGKDGYGGRGSGKTEVPRDPEESALARFCDGRHNLAFYICWSRDLCAVPYRAHAPWRTTVA